MPGDMMRRDDRRRTADRFSLASIAGDLRDDDMSALQSIATDASQRCHEAARAQPLKAGRLEDYKSQGGGGGLIHLYGDDFFSILAAMPRVTPPSMRALKDMSDGRFRARHVNAAYAPHDII